MQCHDPRWLQHLDIITAWGEASAINRTPPPTDDQLWDAARLRRDLQLPEHADPDLLTQLRAAFDAGRGPTPIDLDAVAAAVTARGVPAQILNSTGSTATLYTGPQTLDPSGDIRFTTSAGPGRFDGPDDTRPMADRDACRIGPHDGSWDVTASEDATTDQLAELIVAVHAHADEQYTRYLAAVAAARAAIWTAFATAYPDASTSDLPDEFDTTVVAELAMLLTRWLDQRWPAYHRAPEQPDDVLGGTDARTCDDRPSWPAAGPSA
jgi:hypothetical protein